MNEIKLIPSKTYKTKSNMLVAIEKLAKAAPHVDFRYITCRTEEGRYYPIFIGKDSWEAVHFGFCAAA